MGNPRDKEELYKGTHGMTDNQTGCLSGVRIDRGSSWDITSRWTSQMIPGPAGSNKFLMSTFLKFFRDQKRSKSKVQPGKDKSLLSLTLESSLSKSWHIPADILHDRWVMCY